ncbi:MAG: argininosuccinate lyase [bacterium]
MSLIWDKGASHVDARIQAFSAGDDVLLDRKLIGFDIQASKAHALGLVSTGILTQPEATQLIEALKQLEQALERGDFVLDDRFEDGHSAIESYLTELLGDLGKKIHTGRSRNDQVLVATRLYLKSALNEVAGLLDAAARVCLTRATASMFVPMPGYTHLQPAVPSSLGMWFAAFCEAFIDNRDLAAMTARWVDKNPLGTAAGYGVNLKLDRALTTRELGFGELQISPIYAQNSRGKFEIQTLDVFCQALLDVRRMAWDLSLFTTAEFAFAKLPSGYTTGSSIMPNKRNPDIIELLRAAFAPVEAARSEIVHILSLPSGYHRDLQGTKPPLIRGVEQGLQALSLIPDLLEKVQFDDDRMLAAISPDMYATDYAVELAVAHVPFRDAYRQAAEKIGEMTTGDPAASLRNRVSPGGAADAMLEVLEARLNTRSA